VLQRTAAALTFRRQLLIVFGTLVAVVGAAVLLSFARLGDVDDAREHIGTQSAPYAAAVNAAATDMKGMANDERGYLMTGDSKFLGEISDRAKKVRGELAEATKVAGEPDDAEAADKIAAGFETWANAVDAELATFKTDRQGAVKLALGKNRDLRKAYEEDLKAALADGKADLDEALGEVQAKAGGTRTGLLAALLAMVALGIGGCYWLERRTRRRLEPLLARLRSLDENCVKGLDAGLSAMASGDLTVEVIPVTTPIEEGPKDQIGLACETTNLLLGKIQASVASYNRTRTELSSLIGEIAGSSRTLASASTQMASTSEEAGRAVGEIALAVGEVAQGAERQVRMVESTRAAVQEAARAAAASSDTAEATTEAAENARRTAREGVDAAEHASEAIQHVAASSE